MSQVGATCVLVRVGGFPVTPVSALIVADSSNHVIRSIDTSTGTTVTIAGGGSSGGTSVGRNDGVGTAATFAYPYGLATVANGSTVFIAGYVWSELRVYCFRVCNQLCFRPFAQQTMRIH